jgi:proline racemase
VPRGRTMFDKRDWACAHADQLRRLVLFEPRGHADMCGAVLTEPIAPGAHAGVLFMHNGGFGDLSLSGLVAVTTIALERGLLMPGGSGTTVVFDTTAGSVRAHASSSGARVERVSLTGVPSFVLHGGITVRLGERHVRADVAFGGAFYAIVDSEAVGVAIDAEHVAELRRAGREIARAVESALTIVHPAEQRLHGICGTIFTGPPHGFDADLRTVTVFADCAVARTASGTGGAAVLSVLDAMGLVGGDTPVVYEGLAGTHLTFRVAGRSMVGDYNALVPEVTGSAWITGDHTFVADDTDPFREGFRV